MLTAIAIDDEPLALKAITILCEQIPFVRLAATFTRPTEAIGYLHSEKIDLIFLDIRMPDITGIDFVNSLSKPVMVIFTTAYSEYAVQCFELDAVDYLLKPFSFARLLKACSKAADLHVLRSESTRPTAFRKSLFVKSGYEQVKVILDDILYIESLGNYVQFICTNGKVVSRLTMNETADLLPKENFLRIHRSYLVAKSIITKVDKQTVWLKDKALPIGEVFAHDIQQYLKS
ncbi:DNA-binding response regulator [Mucilaginibacter conchicola]|uniref:DNA-binding response regulator n=1 Tax=Mucilaginibacter conchicola TaxID=2303333 RepID=A0A372NNZ2_9SPHI|nr:LytTR family DNA-binding domain-containing protein [Mucilaginibacter conchicola]RFZ90095.1 DNA-binding response regulator [Mucilaginibacter conchicola]